MQLTAHTVMLQGTFYWCTDRSKLAVEDCK